MQDESWRESVAVDSRVGEFECSFDSVGLQDVEGLELDDGGFGEGESPLADSLGCDFEFPSLSDEGSVGFLLDSDSCGCDESVE